MGFRVIVPLKWIHTALGTLQQDPHVPPILSTSGGLYPSMIFGGR